MCDIWSDVHDGYCLDWIESVYMCAYKFYSIIFAVMAFGIENEDFGYSKSSFVYYMIEWCAGASYT